MQNLRWAFLGTGRQAVSMAVTFSHAERHISSVGSRTSEHATVFADQFSIPRCYTDYHDIFSDPEIDIIYIATPPETHYKLIMEALDGGKNILCENVITLNASELSAAQKKAHEKGLILAEAQTVYHMPLLLQLKKRILDGEFGNVNLINVSYGKFGDFDRKDNEFSQSVSGGAILEIGVYALSCIRMFLHTQPDQIRTLMETAPDGTDDRSVTILKNAEGQLAALSLSMNSRQPKNAMISCDRGFISIEDFPRAEEAVVIGNESEEKKLILAGNQEDALLYEVQDMEKAVCTGDDSIMCPDLSLDVMEMISRMRSEWDSRFDTQ